MFCPQCGAEYTPGIPTCSDCGVPLVDHLPDDMDPERRQYDYTEIMQTFEQTEVAVMQSLLDGSGIDYFFQGERNRQIGLPYQAIRLFVRKGQEETARSLLKNPEPPSDDGETE